MPPFLPGQASLRFPNALFQAAAGGEDTYVPVNLCKKELTNKLYFEARKAD